MRFCATQTEGYVNVRMFFIPHFFLSANSVFLKIDVLNKRKKRHFHRQRSFSTLEIFQNVTRYVIVHISRSFVIESCSYSLQNKKVTQLTFVCLKSTIGRLEKGVKYVQS